MDDNGRDIVAEEVERQQDKIYSRQPRFQPDADGFYISTLHWLRELSDSEPEYSSNSRERDAWLQRFRYKEPHLMGVINGAVLVDANRGWTMTGGRNQVLRYTRVMHAADNFAGWRDYFRGGSLSYWTTDMCFVNENGRDGQGGPLRALYNVDPARCQLTGDIDQPLKYYPPKGRVQYWQREDFFRVVSLPSDDETYHGLGFCALSRAIELARIMIAVYRHDQEQLLAQTPRGLLLLHGIGTEQWEQALRAREARLRSKDWEVYSGVETLCSSGIEQLDAKLVALSQLPSGFDRAVFTDQLMYGYALCFGYDPREFWPVSGGALGTATETETQHRKASGKGAMDFTSGYQDRLQNDPLLLPETLLFEFDERDDEGELLAASVAQAWVEVAARAYEAGAMTGGSLLDLEQARSLLAEHGVIPAEWTEMEEDIQTTDEGETRGRLREHLKIRTAAARFETEPVVRYHWPSHRLQVLWDSGADMLRPRVWRGVQVERQAGDEEILYQDETLTITMADAARAIAGGARRVGSEFGAVLEAETVEESEEA